jgi:hypothetical protein
MNIREESIALALAAIGNGASERKTAKEYGIPRTTLQSRRTGCSTASSGHHHQQRLSPHQENCLCDWIKEQEACGYAPSHARAREMATLMLTLSGDTKPLGKKWVPTFMKRNRQIASIIGKPIDAARIRGTQPHHIHDFYERFDTIRASHNTQQQDIWNMDEHGIALGVCTNSVVLGASGKHKTYIQTPENREWVSVIEGINALGHFIRPLVMFKGKDVQTSWFTAEHIPDWLITTTSKGWTSNDIGLRWLKEVFLPETARILQNGRTAHRLLLLDGHGSHATVEFMWICKQNQVDILYLPAHSSHVLQPLDLGTFSPLKSPYRKEIADLAHLDDAAPVKKRRFVQAYQKARIETFTPRTLRAGWSAAGLFPWNPSKTLNSSQLHQISPAESEKEPTSPTPTCPAPPTPSTPKRPRPVDNSDLLRTPKQPRDIYESVKSLGPLTRDQRTVFQKAQKALGEATAQHATLHAKNRRLHLRIEELESKRKKKKVIMDPNTVFANVESIKRSLEEAERARVVQEAEKARIAEKKALAKAKEPSAEEEASRTSRALQRAQMEACIFQWEL